MTEDLNKCPKCGAPRRGKVGVCRSCGLIFEKFGQVQEKRKKDEKRRKAEERADAAMEPPRPRSTPRILLALLVAAAALAVFMRLPREAETTPPRQSEPAPQPATALSRRPAVGPARPAPVRAGAVDYEGYRAALDRTCETLDALGRKIRGENGILYSDFDRAVLKARGDIAVLLVQFPGEPFRGYASLRAGESAVENLEGAQKIWNLRTNAEAYKDTYWGRTVDFAHQTEEGFRGAMGEYVRECWDTAIDQVALACQFAKGELGESMETNPLVHERIRASSDRVARIWKEIAALARPASAATGG